MDWLLAIALFSVPEFEERLQGAGVLELRCW